MIVRNINYTPLFHTFSILCLVLSVLVWGGKFEGIYSNVFVGLVLPAVCFLFFQAHIENVFSRTGILFSILYAKLIIPAEVIEFMEIIGLLIVAFILQPPARFIQMTMYAFWLVALFHVWQEREIITMTFEGAGTGTGILNAISNTSFSILFILVIGYIGGLYFTDAKQHYYKKNVYLFIMGLAGSYLLVPAIVFGGVLRAVYQALYQFWKRLLSTVRFHPPLIQSKHENYLAQKALTQWKDTVKGTLQDYKQVMRTWFANIKSYFAIYNWMMSLYYALFILTAIVTLAVSGIVVLAVFGTLHIMLLAVALSVYHSLRIGFYHVDRLYRNVHRIETVCVHCHHYSELPLYVCSTCQTVHEDLKPGRFGIFRRKCQCGSKLPTSVLNGRSELPARCPSCQSPHEGRESTPICIPVIGGPSTGKTSFWTSGMKQLQDMWSGNISVAWQNRQQEHDFLQNVHALTNRTAPTRTKEIVPVGTVVSLTKQKWKRDKLLYFYDPAGHAFGQSGVLKSMKFLSFAHGIVLVIDPQSAGVATLSSKYGESDTAGVDPEEIIDRLLLYYQDELGIKVHEKIRTPLAVVLHKADMVVWNEAASEVSAVRNDTGDRTESAHETCIQWLQASGKQHLLRKLDHQFATYRIFMTSAFSDSADLQPVHALEWILHQADKNLIQVEKGNR